MRSKGILSSTCLILTTAFACTAAYQGIKIRAQSPMISEASRRLSLALRADGYQIEEGSILGLRQVSDWREMLEKEKTEEERASESVEEARINIQLHQRGSLYDVFVLITIRAGGAEYHPDSLHPITQKWQKLVKELIEEEFREEGRLMDNGGWIMENG